MRGVVRAFAAAGLSVYRVQRAGSGRRILRAGAAVQLSALHGHDLSRLPYSRGFREIQDLHHPHYRAAAHHRAVGPWIPAPAAVDLHALPHLESLALHGTELWTLHDVRAAQRRAALAARPQFALRRLHRVLRDGL